jgi:hypothetical protein
MIKSHGADRLLFVPICAFCISVVSVYLQLSIVTDTCTLVNVIGLYVYESLFLCQVLFNVFCFDMPALLQGNDLYANTYCERKMCVVPSSVFDKLVGTMGEVRLWRTGMNCHYF